MADKYYDELVEVMIPRRLAIKLKNILAKNPDADVVGVVRCKDCKHAKAVMHRGEEMPGIFKCTYLKANTTMFDIDFCRHGKRDEK